MNTKKITLRTSSGIEKGTVDLVDWTEPLLLKTHNGDTRFKYLIGCDAEGVWYETKSRGGGWRRMAAPPTPSSKGREAAGL